MKNNNTLFLLIMIVNCICVSFVFAEQTGDRFISDLNSAWIHQDYARCFARINERQLSHNDDIASLIAKACYYILVDADLENAMNTFNIIDPLIVKITSTNKENIIYLYEMLRENARVAQSIPTPIPPTEEEMAWARNYAFPSSYPEEELLKEVLFAADNCSSGVSIFYPVNNNTMKPGIINIEARAWGCPRNVVRVEFFADDNSIGFASDEPYRIQWDQKENKTYKLSAIATYNDDSTITSPEVHVTLNDDSTNDANYRITLFAYSFSYSENWNTSVFLSQIDASLDLFKTNSNPDAKSTTFLVDNIEKAIKNRITNYPNSQDELCVRVRRLCNLLNEEKINRIVQSCDTEDSLADSLVASRERLIDLCNINLVSPLSVKIDGPLGFHTEGACLHGGNSLYIGGYSAEVYSEWIDSPGCGGVNCRILVNLKLEYIDKQWVLTAFTKGFPPSNVEYEEVSVVWKARSSNSSYIPTMLVSCNYGNAYISDDCPEQIKHHSSYDTPMVGVYTDPELTLESMVGMPMEREYLMDKSIWSSTQIRNSYNIRLIKLFLHCEGGEGLNRYWKLSKVTEKLDNTIETEVWIKPFNSCYPPVGVWVNENNTVYTSKSGEYHLGWKSCLPVLKITDYNSNDEVSKVTYACRKSITLDPDNPDSDVMEGWYISGNNYGESFLRREKTQYHYYNRTYTAQSGWSDWSQSRHADGYWPYITYHLHKFKSSLCPSISNLEIWGKRLPDVTPISPGVCPPPSLNH